MKLFSRFFTGAVALTAASVDPGSALSCLKASTARDGRFNPSGPPAHPVPKGWNSL